VIEDAGLNRSALVAPDGRITMPLAGAIQAGGRTIDQVQAELVTQLAGSFATPPTVIVSLERLAERVPASGVAAAPATIDIFVLGEAGKPGRLALQPGTTVLQAFAEMGGFTRFAAKKRLQLRRGTETWALDYTAIEAGTSRAGDTVLMDGDVIVVPQRRLFE
jgi:polysaccharide export outer membrane protein